MATIEGIRQTGQQIYDATEPNSVTNQIEGQAFKDIADVLEESASLGIKKTYLTNSDMQSDASPNPIGDDGNLIKNGELVSVTDDPDPNKNGIYAYVITDGVGVWRYRGGPLGDVSNKADKTDASGNLLSTFRQEHSPLSATMNTPMPSWMRKTTCCGGANDGTVPLLTVTIPSPIISNTTNNISEK